MEKMGRVVFGLVIGCALALAGVSIHVAQAGGGGCCMVVSLDELPQQITAGERLTLSFIVRFNSQRWPSWDGMVTAVHTESGETITAVSTPTDETGRFTVDLTFPQAGEWRWSVNRQTMPPLRVRAAAPTGAAAMSAAAPAPLAPLAVGIGGAAATAVGLFLWLRRRTPLRLAFVALAAVVAIGGFVWWAAPEAALAERETAVAAIAPEEIGAALFVAKGCTTCHRHDGNPFANSTAQIGPDLTHYRGNPDFLNDWLRNPKAVRPNTFMPNLELSEAEIDALIDYLTAGGT